MFFSHCGTPNITPQYNFSHQSNPVHYYRRSFRHQKITQNIPHRTAADIPYRTAADIPYRTVADIPQFNMFLISL
jgi:hypothetical protein